MSLCLLFASSFADETAGVILHDRWSARRKARARWRELLSEVER